MNRRFLVGFYMVVAETQILMPADLCGGILFVITYTSFATNTFVTNSAKTELFVVEYSLCKVAFGVLMMRLLLCAY